MWSPAKSAVPVTPALKQMRGVNLLLLAAQFILLIVAVLAGANGFEHFALAKGLMVVASGPLALAFEVANFRLELLAQVFEVLAVERCELELGGAAARRQAGGVGLSGIGEEAIELRERILGASHGETGFPQSQGVLPLDALAKTEQRRERETESHGSQDERAIRRPSESFMPATSSAPLMRKSRSAGMSTMAWSRSGSLFFWYAPMRINSSEAL